MSKIRSATEIVDTNFPTKKYSAETRRLIKNVIKEAQRQAIKATIDIIATKVTLDVDFGKDSDLILDLINSKDLKVT